MHVFRCHYCPRFVRKGRYICGECFRMDYTRFFQNSGK